MPQLFECNFGLLVDAALLLRRYNLGYSDLLLPDGHLFVQLGQLMHSEVNIIEFTIEQNAPLIQALCCPLPY